MLKIGCLMKFPELPEDEASRLRALRALGILDTQSEERFDRLTRMARRLFNVPMAVLSLVDDSRVWFKSCIGLEITQVPRELSFCGHAILGDQVFVVPDALADARFAEHPFVLGPPYLRFYAGCPLRLHDGHQLGTLCILDTQARQLNSEDLNLLCDLTRMVVDELSALKLASVDALTQISTRFGFEELAQVSLRFCSQNQIPLCLSFFDLNKFKEINDQFGHAVGDQALCCFANAMKASFRTTDLLARLGGDEFVALLIGADKERAEVALQHLQSLITQANQQHWNSFQLDFSYGVVEFEPHKHANILALLQESDQLMYRNKFQAQANIAV